MILQHGSRQFPKIILGLGSYQKTVSEHLRLCSGISREIRGNVKPVFSVARFFQQLSAVWQANEAKGSILLCIDPWGMVSNKVIDVSACWIIRVLNISSHLGFYNKRRWLQSRMTSLQAIYCFDYDETSTIPSDRLEMVAICFTCFR